MGTIEIINRLYAYKDESKDERLNDLLDDTINLIISLATQADIVKCGKCKKCEERTTLNGLPFLYCLKMEVSVGSDQYCYWGERE